MAGNSYEQKILDAWEETYKKGQLTLWLFLALRDRPRYVAEIKAFIEQYSEATITCEEQSLYRALRKYRDLELVDFRTGEGRKGPDRKYYHLTNLGDRILAAFIERNITLFFNDSLRALLFRTGGPNDDTDS